MIVNPPASLRDVIVVGAGPSGLTAATRLSAAGHDVLLLEEHDEVGQPTHCCGLVGFDAFAELDLPGHTILGTVNAASFYGPNGQSVFIDSDRVQAAVIDRTAFDRALAERAAAAGTETRLNSRVRRIEVEPDRVAVRLAGCDDPLLARACVLACGASYRLHGNLHLGRPRATLQSVQVEVPFPPREAVEVWLGRQVAPAGFAWLVPVTRDRRSSARIGLMCDGHAADAFRTFGRQVFAAAGLDTPLPEPRPRALPIAPSDKTYAARTLAIGDAAGLVKPTTGGGIYYGIVSARIAADVLGACLERDTLGEPQLAEYEHRWRQRLAPEIRAGQTFRSITSRLADGAIDALIDLARTDGIVPLIKRHADFNRHGATALALLRNRSFRRIVVRSFLG